MDYHTEKKHIELLKLGEMESFKAIFDDHHRHVYSFAFKITKSTMLSEEITADVFVKLWQKKEKLDSQYSVMQLLYKITKDFAINYIRKESNLRLRQETFLSEHQVTLHGDVHSDFILKEYLTQTDVIISQLPEKQREAFLLHYKNGYDDKTISEEMQISESTVRVHLSKAVKFLKDYFKTHPEFLRNACWIVVLNNV
jgi:RNA polymerase sigma-70 factor (family 1)